MGLIAKLGVVAIQVADAYAQAAAGPGARTIYFLHDAPQRRWCAYAGEAQFKTEAESLGAGVVGRATYAAGGPSRVELTEGDETGDWEVYDDYSIRPGGSPWRLNRTVSIIPEDLRETQSFLIENGSPVEQKKTFTDLHTARATNQRAEWFTSPSIFTRAQQFPFWPLITARRAAVVRDGKVCMAGAAVDAGEGPAKSPAAPLPRKPEPKVKE